MKITLEIDELDYGALVAARLPTVHEKIGKEESSVTNKIILKLTSLSPAIVKKMVNLLPKETQDEIVVLLINKNCEKLTELLEKLAKEKDISLRIGRLEAQMKASDPEKDEKEMIAL